MFAELYLRAIIPYDIGHYTAVRKERTYHYPYGQIHINSAGFPDQEFDVSGTRPRIGYMGDSIVIGVGVGGGYRFGDLIEKGYNLHDHWTFAMMGNGLKERDLYLLIDTFDLNTVVYGLNLNDFFARHRR